MIKQKGFTLIEIVIVIVILGILGAIAIPKFIDLSGEARAAAADSNGSAVKSAWAIYIAKNKDQPTAQQLTDSVTAQHGVALAADNKSILIDMDSGAPQPKYKTQVSLFKDDGCSAGQETTVTTDKVKCIGAPTVVAGTVL